MRKCKTNNADIRTLADSELDTVTGGQTPFYGMNCSVNQGQAIAGIQGALGSVPIVGGILAIGVQLAGWIICG